MADINGTSGNNTLNGTAGDDVVHAGAGNDNVFDQGGNDQIYGEDGNDYLIAADGDDTVYGGAGTDTISGGHGTDLVYGEGDDDNLRGDQGNDTIYGGDGRDTIRGDSYTWGSSDNGADQLYGDAGNDSIHGDEGNDTIDGGEGSDFLFGGTGSDVVDGGIGNDSLTGYGYGAYDPTDTATDTLRGGEGDDRFTVRYGDTVDGGIGTDSAYLYLYNAPTGAVFDARDLENNGTASLGGGSLTNIEYISGAILTAYDDEFIGGAIPPGVTGISIDGGSGNDTLTDTVGVDTIYGSIGDDVIRGGRGRDPGIAPSTDRLRGDEGNDIIYTGPDGALASGGAQDDIVYGGTGQDSIHGDNGNDRLLGGGGNDGLDGGNGADTLRGDDGDDLLIGFYGGDTLAGGSGNDTLYGDLSYLTGWDSYADTLDGGRGNDILDGGDGADRMTGGGGNDIFFVSEAGDKVVEFDGQGKDIVNSVVSYSLGGTFAEVLNLIGNAALNGGGNALDNRIVGNALDNKLVGGAGNDRLDGASGVDTMEGGVGNDVFVVDDAGDKAVEKVGEGNDTVEAWISFDLVGQHVEVLRLMGSANLDATGNGLGNALYGNAGNNLLNGMTGADTMQGGAGDDRYIVDNAGDKVLEAVGEGTDTVESSVTFSIVGRHVEVLTLTGSAAIDGAGNTLANTLTGNAAANVLNGGDGDDALHGGLGADTLIGGAGLDSYWFETALGGGNGDVITGYDVADDTIHLDRSIFAGIAADGALAADAFALGTAAADADDRILYDAATGRIYYDADGVGGTAAVLFARVAANTALTAADFFAEP